MKEGNGPKSRMNNINVHKQSLSLNRIQDMTYFVFTQSSRCGKWMWWRKNQREYKKYKETGTDDNKHVKHHSQSLSILLRNKHHKTTTEVCLMLTQCLSEVIVVDIEKLSVISWRSTRDPDPLVVLCIPSSSSLPSHVDLETTSNRTKTTKSSKNRPKPHDHKPHWYTS